MMSNTFTTQDPSTGADLEKYSYFSADEVEKRIEKSYRFWKKFRHSDVTERAARLKKVAEILLREQAPLARMMTQEMGKPLQESKAEIQKSADTFLWLSGKVKDWTRTEEFEAPFTKAEVLKESLGPVLMIMPWNFPLWQAVRFAGPAIMAGNTALLKHSDSVAGFAEMLEVIFQEAFDGQPFLQNFRVPHEVAEKSMQDFRIRGVTFTGSTRGGREVAAHAGRALKKCVLELGGSDAYFVLADAELEQAAKTCAAARLINTGQSCVAAKRFIVHESLAQDFIRIMGEEFERKVVGSPLDEKTNLGVLAQSKFKTQLEKQVQDLKSQGAELVFKTKHQSQSPAFVPPQILRAPLHLKAAHEVELFGPVALVLTYSDLQEAIEIVNRSPYGLGAAIFSRDVQQAEKLAREIEAGYVAINGSVKSDVRLPFGGVKDSGFGRELSEFGFLEFLNLKTRVR